MRKSPLKPQFSRRQKFLYISTVQKIGTHTKRQPYGSGYSHTAVFTLFSLRQQLLSGFVLVLCCKSASYMSFAFIFLKYLFCLLVKLRRGSFQPFGKVLMYRGFAYPEGCGSGTNSGFCFYHMLCELHAPFIFPIVHKSHSNTFWCIKVYAVKIGILQYSANQVSDCLYSYSPMYSNRLNISPPRTTVSFHIDAGRTQSSPSPYRAR